MDTNTIKAYQEYHIPESEPLISDTIHIGHNLPNIRSHIRIGNMLISNTHHFNWFHRKMWKLFFGFDVENIKKGS